MLSIILAQYIGIYGVALGTTIPALVNTLILRPRYTCEQLNIPAMAYYKILGKGLLLAFIVFLPGYFISDIIEINNWFTFILFGGILSASYALCYSRLAMDQKTTEYVLDSVPQKLAPFVKLFTGAQKV